MVYEPQEDSLILRTFVRRYAKGKVLDIGTGSGIQAAAAYRKPTVTKVIGTDIDPEAIKYCKKHIDLNIEWKKGSLFTPFREKKWKHHFDTIIFNPPYLPQEGRTRHIDLEGGKKGWEVIDEFLEKASYYLTETGTILLVFSSHTDKQHVLEKAEKELYEHKELGMRRLFFEELYVYRLTKSKLLKEMNKKGISKIKYLTQGKRGNIYTGEYRNKKVAIKTRRKESTAPGTITKEARWLKKLNSHDIGPKYRFHTENFIVYDYVEGEHLKDLIGKKKLGTVLKKVLDKCYKMDQLGIQKEEMIRPLKNVIVKGQKATLIDFERARSVENAHNVTQFCQFLMNHAKRLKLNRNKIQKLAKEYSKDEKTIKKIRQELR